MASAQRIQVRWNNHAINFPKVFNTLRSKGELLDVTLAVEGELLKAHKLVLAAASPYFHEIFKDNPSKHPTVIMRDFRFKDVEAIVEYMYKGEVQIDRQDLRRS